MTNIRTLAPVGAGLVAMLLAAQTPAQARDDCTFIFCLPSGRTAEPKNDEAAAAPPLRLLSYSAKRKSARGAPSRATVKRSARSSAKKRVRASKARRMVRNARRAAQRAMAQAQPAPAAKAPVDNVMRGADSVSLIAMLPWWRSDRMQQIFYAREKGEPESQVLASADAWVSQHGPSDAMVVVDDFEHTQMAGEYAGANADTPGDVDPQAFNAIDLAAGDSRPPERSFLQSLIAILGGAFAAASAARFLLLV
jgi:hypothetical protein